MDDPREAQRLTDKVDAERWVKEHLLKHLDSAKKVLDVGCGPGHLAIVVAQHAEYVTGIDVSPLRFEG